MGSCFMGCEPQPHPDEKYYIVVMPEITIYGHTVDTWIKENHPEDWSDIQSARIDDYEFGCWHSEVVPDGEIGSQHLSICREITREQWHSAQHAEWPTTPIDGHGFTTDQPATRILGVNEKGELVEFWNSMEGDVA